MKWLIPCLAVLFMVAPAMAGEDPYIAIVGTDCVSSTTNTYGTCPDSEVSGVDINGATVIGQAKPWYFSPKYQQFMYNENDPNSFAIPVSFGTFPPVNQWTRVGSAGTEQYRSQTANNMPEVCARDCDAGGIHNAKTPAGNSGFYEWYIHLPLKPSGEINIVIQCGVLKPNALAFYPGCEPDDTAAIELCAAETGEWIGAGLCVRQEVDPGVSPVNQLGLPKITAIAYPGVYSGGAWTPFHLTAFKNPGSYILTFDASGAMTNGSSSQILDGSTNARALLKACMDKSIVAKLPVEGQLNAMGETERDLEPGDLIYVRMDIPRQNTVDVYCNATSVRLQGVGETIF